MRKNQFYYRLFEKIGISGLKTQLADAVDEAQNSVIIENIDNIDFEKIYSRAREIAILGEWDVEIVNKILTCGEILNKVNEVKSVDADMEHTKKWHNSDEISETDEGNTIQSKMDFNTIKLLQKNLFGKPETVNCPSEKMNGIARKSFSSRRFEDEWKYTGDKFQDLIMAMDGMDWEADAKTLKMTYVSRNIKELLGYQSDEWMVQQSFKTDHIHPDDKERIISSYAEIKTQKHRTLYYRMIKADRTQIWVKELVCAVIAKNKSRKLCGRITNWTVNMRTTDLERLEKSVLELNLRSNKSIEQVLSMYTRGIESLFPYLHCSILQIKNGVLFNWSSPSLPREYIDAVNNLPIGENVGSCGTAAFLKKKVIAHDISTDPRWVDYRDVALSLNLRACWSYPIINSLGDVMATFAIYYDQIKTPDEEELKVIERSVAILRIILEIRQNTETQHEASLLMAQGEQLAKFGTWQWTISNNALQWSNSLYSIYGLCANSFEATIENYFELLFADDRYRVRRLLKNALDSKNDVEYEERIVRPTGEIRHLKSWAKVKCDEDGKAVKMFGACLDIAETKKTQEERQDYLRAIEQQKQKLQEISWMQSHVVRAPLARIMGIVDLIKNYPNTDEEKSILMDHLLISANEIDQVIRTISNNSSFIK